MNSPANAMVGPMFCRIFLPFDWEGLFPSLCFNTTCGQTIVQVLNQDFRKTFSGAGRLGGVAYGAWI